MGTSALGMLWQVLALPYLKGTKQQSGDISIWDIVAGTGTSIVKGN